MKMPQYNHIIVDPKKRREKEKTKKKKKQKNSTCIGNTISICFVTIRLWK